MNAPSREMRDIQIGLWQVGRNLDLTARELTDRTFEQAIADLQDLWRRFGIEVEKQEEVPEHE